MSDHAFYQYAMLTSARRLHSAIATANLVHALVIYTNTQTPLHEQVGQQVGNLLANKFASGAPDTNLLYNLLAAIPPT
jgi:hypothetical protein